MTKGFPNTEVSKINEILGDFIKKKNKQTGPGMARNIPQMIKRFFEMLIFAFILIFFLGE